MGFPWDFPRGFWPTLPRSRDAGDAGLLHWGGDSTLLIGSAPTQVNGLVIGNFRESRSFKVILLASGTWKMLRLSVTIGQSKTTLDRQIMKYWCSRDKPCMIDRDMPAVVCFQYTKLACRMVQPLYVDLPRGKSPVFGNFFWFFQLISSSSHI